MAFTTSSGSDLTRNCNSNAAVVSYVPKELGKQKRKNDVLTGKSIYITPMARLQDSVMNRKVNSFMGRLRANGATGSVFEENAVVCP
jgi:hypothetical protein